MSIQAINKEYQTEVNRAYSHYRNYHELVNAGSDSSGKDELKDNNQKQLKAFDKYYDLYCSLPQPEQVNFDLQHIQLHGYA